MDAVRDQFRKISNSLSADAAKAAGTGHGSTTGSIRELVVRGFLRPHLPLDLSVKAGVIIDSHGNKSAQQDCVITDNRLPLIDIGDEVNAILLAESVIATIEVKSYLNKNELLKTLWSIKKTKALKRNGDQKYSKAGIEVLPGEPLPLLTYVFAFDGDSLESLFRHCAEYAVTENDGGLIPEAICILGKGLISRSSLMPDVNMSKRLVTMPSAAGTPQLSTIPLEQDALFSFYRRLIDDVIPLRMKNYDIDGYYNSSALK